MSTLGERIAEVRKSSGLSQDEFGALGGVGRQTQINYEKDVRFPDVTYLVAIANSGYDISYIMFGRRGLYFDKVPAQGHVDLKACDVPPAIYMTPSEELASEICKMSLSEDDAQLVLALAKRLTTVK